MSGTATFSIDRAEFDAAVNRLRKRGIDAASRAALLELGDAFVTFIIRTAPRDTNRFVRGYILAWNSIPGARKKTLPPLEVSEFADRIEDALRRDLAFATRVREGFHKKVRRLKGIRANTARGGARGESLSSLDKRIRKAERELDKAGDLEDRAITNLESFERAKANNEPGFAIVFARRRGKKGSKTALSRVSRVFTADRTFGGVGRLVRIGPDAWALQLENLEPHARIVNRRTRVVSRAAALARRAGARRASDRAIRELQAAWDGRGVSGKVA